jgi:Met-zincin/Domain of unknown function (DUF5117)
MRNRVALLLAGVLLCSFALRAQAPTSESGSEVKKDEAKKDKEESSKPKPFAEVVKEAEVIRGMFSFYRTEDKVFMELLPNQFEKMYMLSLTCETGLGERGFYASMMCGEVPIIFHKTGKNIQLLGKNTSFVAQDDTPIQRAVTRSYSDSILGASKIECPPHPERKSVLIDLGALLLADFPMLSYGLEQNFRIGYHFDSKNSSFGTLKGFDHSVEIETIAHYTVDRLPVPPLLPPGAPAPPLPPPPRNLVDVRSMIFHMRYSLSELPAAGYRPRLADDRVGHFFLQQEDFTEDLKYAPARRFIHRWRLEKQDSSAPLSRPKQPIVFWLENTIPLKYRDAIRDGILMWNKAFERIGVQDAIEAKQQPDDADWDPADVRYNTVRWFTCTDCGFAIGPSRANPLTGEIYDADIGFSEALTRFSRRQLNEELKPLVWPWEAGAPQPFLAPWSVHQLQYFCDLGTGAVQDAQFSFDVLLTRGMEPEGPEADRFVQGFLREIAAHEVGHTLGLRHNFRASTIHTLEQTENPQLTASEGLTGSVMDYIPTNVASRGSRQGEFHQSVLGPYDYWAIEYAYKPIEASTPEGELPELQKIAARAAEPELAYATDEDAGVSREPYDMDPVVNRFDLGSDPLKYYGRRIKLSQEIWANMEDKLQKPGEGYQVLRRSFTSALFQVGTSLYLSSKYLGGVSHYRDHVGDPSGRLPFQPTPATRQREALNLLRQNLFAPQAFDFSPALLNKLANERFTNFRDFSSLLTRFDFPVHSLVLSLQKSVLDRLYHPIVMSRILDSEVKSDSSPQVFRLSELFTGIQDAIWAETRGTGSTLDINSYRRSLEREHLRKLIALVLREGGAPEDARTLARQGLVSLRSQLQSTLGRTEPKTPLETRAHLSESLARIDEALKANQQRTAF